MIPNGWDHRWAALWENKNARQPWPLLVIIKRDTSIHRVFVPEIFFSRMLSCKHNAVWISQCIKEGYCWSRQHQKKEYPSGFIKLKRVLFIKKLMWLWLRPMVPFARGTGGSSFLYPGGTAKGSRWRRHGAFKYGSSLHVWRQIKNIRA